MLTAFPLVESFNRVQYCLVCPYIPIQISKALLYTNNKLSERDIKETIPFTITSKRIKYLGNVKEVHTETHYK